MEGREGVWVYERTEEEWCWEVEAEGEVEDS